MTAAGPVCGALDCHLGKYIWVLQTALVGGALLPSREIYLGTSAGFRLLGLGLDS